MCIGGAVLAPPEDYPGFGHSNASLGNLSFSTIGYRLWVIRAVAPATARPSDARKKELCYLLFAIRYYSAARSAALYL
jgi:hypothetical protein